MIPSWIITSSMLASYGLSKEDSTRLEVSITVLLALTTFKFVVVERLPDVDYATLIDYYVLSCFIFAFGLIIAQTLAMLAMYDETPWVYDVTGWWPTRQPPPLIFSFPPPLLIGGGVWWLFHALILVAYAFVFVRRHLVMPQNRRVCGKKWGSGGWWDYEMRTRGVMDDEETRAAHPNTPRLRHHSRRQSGRLHAPKPMDEQVLDGEAGDTNLVSVL